LATLGSRESPNEFVKVLKRGLSVCPADYEALVKLEWAVGHLLQETLVDNPAIVDSRQTDRALLVSRKKRRSAARSDECDQI